MLRRRLAARGVCALFAQARWRGRAGRKVARLAWVRANAAATFAEKWRCLAHRRRYAVLRRLLAGRRDAVPPRTMETVARLVEAARRGAVPPSPPPLPPVRFSASHDAFRVPTSRGRYFLSKI